LDEDEEQFDEVTKDMGYYTLMYYHNIFKTVMHARLFKGSVQFADIPYDEIDLHSSFAVVLEDVAEKKAKEDADERERIRKLNARK